MLTPQEVSEHVFAKASFGGYNMSMVDEFLDVVTEDYTALYKENAILKSKMKVLADKIEEYRSTEDAMRKTLLTAQRMADEMVKEAEEKKNMLVASAEAEARKQIESLRREAQSEQLRLKSAKETTAAYVEKVRAMHEEELARLMNLSETEELPATDVAVPAGSESCAGPAAEEPDTSVQHPVPEKEEPPQPVPAAVSSSARGTPAEDNAPTRRMNLNNLQFGKDFEIR
jgi:cell division initiation protein